MWAHNGQIPGPLMQIRLGDTVRITATNDLPEETTIHWHGLRIDYRMDGVTYGAGMVALVQVGPGPAE